MKIENLSEFYKILPEEERIITDVLRQIIVEQLPAYCKYLTMFPSFMAIKAFALSGRQQFPEVV
jgi:hypothetical protein